MFSAGVTMNHLDLVAKAAKDVGVPRGDAACVVQGVLNAVAEALKAGDEVTLKGLGKLKVKSRAARAARTPAPELSCKRPPARESSSSPRPRSRAQSTANANQARRTCKEADGLGPDAARFILSSDDSETHEQVRHGGKAGGGEPAP